ncbi:MAG: hypothetical protein KDI46_06110 [Alphaproteobacteria bacterium]|nr:hypothetical protein [Alphaproteobacteria bacterium]
MLREWIHSVRRFEQARDMDICILDAGLTPEQIEALRPLVSKIVNPEWPCPLPDHKIRGKDFLKGCVCRPFLPQIFPGYGTYFWMDADTWVQDWRGPELFLQGAAKGKIALTGQVDRAYPRAVRVKWMGRWPWKVRSFYFSNALSAFDFETARTLLPRHVLLAGAFALRADAPHWARWQELVVQAMTKGKVFTAEQLCLGKMCYMEGFEYELLPAYAHWLCEHKPAWDAEHSVFVEPSLPHETIGILHISGWDEMRLDRSVMTDFETLQGGVIRRSYRYADFDGESV